MFKATIAQMLGVAPRAPLSGANEQSVAWRPPQRFYDSSLEHVESNVVRQEGREWRQPVHANGTLEFRLEVNPICCCVSGR